MNNHGGKRKGAGRKKSAPTVVYQLNIDKQLRNELRAKFTAKEINAKIRALLFSLNIVKSCDTCKNLGVCRFWEEAPENGKTCIFYIEFALFK